MIKPSTKIFLFDEATSNLDSHTESAITGELTQILKGKTAIFAAHRLSSIMNVDKIIVMREGGVVEEGRHGELV